MIQASYTRALEQKIKLAEILEMLAGVTPKLTAPVVTMVSYAIIIGRARAVTSPMPSGRRGRSDRARPAGRRSRERWPDLPARPISAWFNSSRPPRSRERALRIAATSTGFLYYVSVTGITGERTELPPSPARKCRPGCKQQTDVPICIGFGISQPEHVRQLAPVADGLIVGSAIVRRIAEAGTQPREAGADKTWATTSARCWPRCRRR